MAELTRVVWYQRTADLDDAPGRWLEAARAHLPEAVPRRFGDTEPFTGRFERDGEAGLRRAWSETDDGLLFLSAGRLVPHATLATPRSRLRGLGDMTGHVRDVGLEPEDERLRAFVLAFAQVSTAVVTVNPAPPADAGSAAGEPYLAGLGQWLGLPSLPPRWCWFGSAYTRALRRTSVPLTPEGEGALWTGGARVPPQWCATPGALEHRDRVALRVPRAVRSGRWWGLRR